MRDQIYKNLRKKYKISKERLKKLEGYYINEYWN